MKKVGALLVALLLLQACSTPVSDKRGSTSGPRFEDVRDGAPPKVEDTSHVPDAVPRYEERTRAGNENPYTVLGKTYYLIEDESAYNERGKASLYGTKFHGRRTFNGEVFDMNGMTAAQYTLPIPSY